MRTLPDAPAITQAAREAVAKLAELVAAPSAPQLPGPVLIGAVGALASLAQRRAALLQPALVPLLALASKVGGGKNLGRAHAFVRAHREPARLKAFCRAHIMHASRAHQTRPATLAMFEGAPSTIPTWPPFHNSPSPLRSTRPRPKRRLR
jgi:hypothetical protein